MNRNGQTLIIFVIMVPVFLILAALVIDLGIVTNAKLKLSGITTTILKESYDTRFEETTKEKIQKLYLKNDIPRENLRITITENGIEIENKYEVSSFFGQLIGIKSYPISIHKKITKVNNEFQITKE